jgi:hypothetical protein
MSELAIWRESRIHCQRPARWPLSHKDIIAELPASSSLELRTQQNRVGIEKRE